jgi:glycosyltransferase involved in cell wall biosynthesis
MNILTLLAARGGNVPVIIAERVDPRQYAIGPLWSRLRRITYSWCRGLVVQTERARESCRPFLGRRTSVHIIPNAVSPPPVCNVRDAFAVEPGRQRIVAMGRLTHQKGFDLLIRGFAALAPRFCNWDVEILGEGPLRQELQDLIGELGLQDRIHLRGWLPDPHRLLSQADLFVLPSRFEGFPNALLEAMACGLPAIASDCDSGPAEIIRNGIDGLLIPCDDVPALTAALDRLLSDQNERRRLAGRAAEVLERFGPEKFFERWETVLAEANALCASPQ